MHRNAYQGGEIRKSVKPPSDVVASILTVIFCLIPVICLGVALWRMA